MSNGRTYHLEAETGKYRLQGFDVAFLTAANLAKE